MSFIYQRTALFLITTLAMVVPVMFSAWLANHHGQMRVQESAIERSAQQLQRATKVSSQVASAIHQMGQEFSHAPCSSEGLRKMRQLVLRMNLLLDVGYVRDNTLTCSAFGLEPVDIGPASYLSATGYFIRLNAAQPGLSGAAINMTTDAQTGFTTLVHPETILDIVSQKDGESHGLVGLSSGRVIASGGRLDARWIKQIQAEKTGVRLMDGTIIAWKHSDQYDYAAFASVSADVVADSVGQTLLVLVPVGVLAGVFITMGVLAFVRNQTSMPALIKAGLRQNEFFTVYQPIVDLKTGQWVGAEALVRWRRSNGEMVGPDTFIPIAESCGLIGSITMRVLELIEADAWTLFSGHEDFFVSINFSADDFSDQAVIDRVAQLVATARISPSQIHVEATERVFMDVETTRRNVARLQEIGVKVSIDDFGTGYSSLSHLTSVQLDALKIDRVFVQTAGTESVTSSVIDHIIAMAKGLNLKIIAEGVETEAQASYLRRHGVEYVQGWLFSKPIDAVSLRAGARSV